MGVDPSRRWLDGERGSYIDDASIGFAADIVHKIDSCDNLFGVVDLIYILRVGTCEARLSQISLLFWPARTRFRLPESCALFENRASLQESSMERKRTYWP